MSKVWNALIDNCDFFINTLAESGQEYFEPTMKKFNNDGWVNRTWKGTGYRRAHVDVVDARDTKGLWMMHCCVFPHFTDESPIYGFDVIAGKNKITGCFIDYSPTTNADHSMLQDFSNLVSQHEWNKVRDLPDWAKRIFSNRMVAASNITTDDELNRIILLAKQTLTCYINNLGCSKEAPIQEVMKMQEYYSDNQKKNPHTPKTMMALGLGEEDVKYFINHCLFPSVYN